MANPEHVELARQGAAAIADWNAKNPDADLDLSNAKLSKANLTEAQLIGADLTEADLIGADLSNLLATPLGSLLTRLAPRADKIPPLVRGIGPLPRPERLYFHFGRSIDTRPYTGRQHDAGLCMALRERVRGAVERGISAVARRAGPRPQRALRARLVKQLRTALAASGNGTRSAAG